MDIFKWMQFETSGFKANCTVLGISTYTSYKTTWCTVGSTSFWSCFALSFWFAPFEGRHIRPGGGGACRLSQVVLFHINLGRRAAAKKKRKCSKLTTSLNMLLALDLCPRPSKLRGPATWPRFRGSFRHPFWGPCFSSSFTGRGSQTLNLGSSSGPQLQCADPTPQTSDPPRDLTYSARVRHHKPRALHYSARVRHHKPRVLHYSARVRHHKPRVLHYSARVLHPVWVLQCFTIATSESNLAFDRWQPYIWHVSDSWLATMHKLSNTVVQALAQRCAITRINNLRETMQSHAQVFAKGAAKKQSKPIHAAHHPIRPHGLPTNTNHQTQTHGFPNQAQAIHLSTQQHTTHIRSLHQTKTPNNSHNISPATHQVTQQAIHLWQLIFFWSAGARDVRDRSRRS